MAPVIRISEATFAKMQMLAQPLVDTSDQVISRALDVALAAQGLSVQARTEPVAEARRLDPEDPGELAHTSVKSVTVGGDTLRPANWNAMLREVHSRALTHLGSFERLASASASHLRPGRHEEQGFYYVPDGDFSVQGQDSNLSWANSLRLAKLIPVSLSVTFTWQHKEGSAHPGETGILEWNPGQN